MKITINKKNTISSEFPGYIGGASNPALMIRDLKGNFMSNKQATDI